MSLITKPSTHSAGDTILASETNSNLDTIYDDYNGNITNDNISSSAAIADSKLAQITSAGKIAGSALGNAWPVGSVYTAVVSTNPATLLGFGTWSAFGAGKVLVGLDSGDTDFDTVEETGGSKTVDISHTHSVPYDGWSLAGSGIIDGNLLSKTDSGNNFQANADNTTGSSGSATQSIVQPYIVVYMWKRTA